MQSKAPFVERLCLENVLAAAEHGAVVLNHALFAVTVPSLGIVGLWGLGLSPASAVRSLLRGGEALRSEAQGASESEGVGPHAPP